MFKMPDFFARLRAKKPQKGLPSRFWEGAGGWGEKGSGWHFAAGPFLSYLPTTGARNCNPQAPEPGTLLLKSSSIFIEAGVSK